LDKRKAFETCQRKIKQSEKAARCSAAVLNRRGEYVHAYRCDICGRWHVGRLKKNRRINIAFARLERERMTGGQR